MKFRLMTIENENDTAVRRRATIAKALNRAFSLGIEVDPDPRFAELLESWADGRLSMRQAREAYLDHIRERDQARADWRALGIATSIAKAKAALNKRQDER